MPFYIIYFTYNINMSFEIKQLKQTRQKSISTTDNRYVSYLDSFWKELFANCMATVIQKEN